jgi:hypothetical protein
MCSNNIGVTKGGSRTEKKGDAGEEGRKEEETW